MFLSINIHVYMYTHVHMYIYTYKYMYICESERGEDRENVHQCVSLHTDCNTHCSTHCNTHYHTHCNTHRMAATTASATSSTYTTLMWRFKMPQVEGRMLPCIHHMQIYTQISICTYFNSATSSMKTMTVLM